MREQNDTHLTERGNEGQEQPTPDREATEVEQAVRDGPAPSPAPTEIIIKIRVETNGLTSATFKKLLKERKVKLVNGSDTVISAQASICSEDNIHIIITNSGV